MASGTLTMTRMVGGTFGVAALGALFGSATRPTSRAPEAFVDALGDALTLSAVALTTAAAIVADG